VSGEGAKRRMGERVKGEGERQRDEGKEGQRDGGND